MQKQAFYSNGKLLLSGEYLVLHGAKALALPLKLGQDLKTSYHSQDKTAHLSWKSHENNQLWFELDLALKDFSILETSDHKTANQLIHYLKVAQKLNPDFLQSEIKVNARTNLTFNRNWGLGSSSSLMNNIAEWAKIDAYQLSDLTTEGSAYDIACASANNSIFYQKSGEKRIVKNAHFNPSFKEHLYFVYLGNKQNSAESVAQFKSLKKPSALLIKEISEIGKLMAGTKSLCEFNKCIITHEKLISSILKQECIKQKHFKHFDGEIKSLGAWGGDFIMVSSEIGPVNVKKYYNQFGLNTIFKYSELSK